MFWCLSSKDSDNCSKEFNDSKAISLSFKKEDMFIVNLGELIDIDTTFNDGDDFNEVFDII